MATDGVGTDGECQPGGDGDGDGDIRFDLGAGDSGGSGVSGGDPTGGGSGGDPTGGDPTGGGSGGDDGGGSRFDVGGGGGDSGGGEPPPPPDPGLLTAGEWNDLDEWAFWTALMQLPEWSGYHQHWGYSTHQRFAMEIQDEGRPVVDADLELWNGDGRRIWDARSDNEGHAELFAGAFGADAGGPFEVIVRSGDEATILEVEPSGGDPIQIELDPGREAADALDLMFVVDTTGSMGDELRYLQAELEDVVRRVEGDRGSLHVRLSVNFYRDCGDEYVVRSFPFTRDVEQAVSWINQQEADGGGNYPEAIDRALANGIWQHDWSENARARLLFLVLDARPHHGDAMLERLHATTTSAAAQGIRVIPVASSGVDRDTESLLRFIEILTGGTYVFLTDDSGIGNPHLEPSVGDYEVEAFNDLLVRLVSAAVR